MSRLAHVIEGVALVVMVARTGHARPTPQAKCAAAKNKAATKKIEAKLACHRKATLAGLDVDPTCLTAAETKFDLATTKAEAAGGCAVTGDGDAIEAACDDAVAAIVALTRVTTTTTLPPTCTDFGGSCGSCVGGGSCTVRTEPYLADDTCAGSGPGTCTCCACVSGACDTATMCATDADCAPGKACILVPLPTGAPSVCCAVCP